ncbi:MAG: CsgG/HfaB family protein [Bdellovibrionota bacterium]
MNTRWLAAVLAAALFGVGCGNKSHRSYLAPKANLQNISIIAVLPFENLTDYPNAGQIVSDLVVTELYAVGRYKVIDAPTALKLYQESGGTLLPAPDRSYAVEVGRAIRADAVVYGSVQEFAYRLDKYRQGTREPAVALTLRMVDVGTGIVLWAASESRSSDAVLSADRDPVNRVALAILRNLREKLAEYLAKAS